MIRGVYQPSTSASSTRKRVVVRRLAAILGTDIVGYSTLMGHAEENTHLRVGEELDRIYREIEKGHGRVFSFAGDGLMAEFPSAIEALKCALRIQADTGKRNARLPADQRILFRIGINSGEIVVQEDRTGGNAVNIAARLEGIAEPGGIALSEAVFQQVHRVVSAGYTFLGDQRLKNIREPVPAHMIPAAECSTWAGMPALPRETQLSGPPDVATEYRASLAVLPFRTLQQDQSDAWFAEGMVDDIIRALDGLNDLLVIARGSTQVFAGAPLDVRRVGHELDVRYVLHGSVRRSRGSLRVAVELREAQTGAVIWVDRSDGKLVDLFNLQDHIATRVATSIAPHLRGRELARARRKHADSMTAYDLTLQALDLFYHADRDSLRRAGALLERAIAIDPNYGPAYSYMAALRMRTIGQGWSENDAADSAIAADYARKAIEREPNDPVALAIYGHIQAYLLKDFAAGMDYLERALSAGPSCALAWGFSSLICGYVGQYAKAITRAERAVRLSPFGLDACRYQHYLSQAYYLADRFEDAVAWGRMSVALAPANASNLCCLTASLVAMDNLPDAQGFARDLMRLVPTFRLSTFRARTPVIGEPGDRLGERLRRAGLPE
jgi:adenylate cyclase